MQKIRKILSAVSEKTALPTNQSTNHYQQHRPYRTWLTPVQKHYQLNNLLCPIRLGLKKVRNTARKKQTWFQKGDERN